jgi:tRNA (guanine-N7-)-methyltransferase
MPKNKLERFAELKAFPNSIYMPYEAAVADTFFMKGKWGAGHFKNDHPIVLELGCGKGEYTVGLSQKYPDRNIIGVDIKGNRMWVGAKKALELKLDNAAFLRTRIDFIGSAFAPGEVSEIWITFPDPHPTQKGVRRRLTSPRFLDRYRGILRPGGFVHLKTDSFLLYEYTLAVIAALKLKLHDSTSDLYGEPDLPGREEVKSIKTYYEARFLAEGKKINYLRFGL